MVLVYLVFPACVISSLFVSEITCLKLLVLNSSAESDISPSPCVVTPPPPPHHTKSEDIG